MLFCFWLTCHTLQKERCDEGSPQNDVLILNIESYSPHIKSLLETITERRSDDGTRRLPADNCWEPQEQEQESARLHSHLRGRL